MLNFLEALLNKDANKKSSGTSHLKITKKQARAVLGNERGNYHGPFYISHH
jgi:hypothetical protein